MTRSPDVPVEVIQFALRTKADGTRPTSVEAAVIVSELVNREVGSALVRQALKRHPEWGFPPGESGRPPRMRYGVDSALAPFRRADKDSHHLVKMRAFERMEAGLVPTDGAWGDAVKSYIFERLTSGQVTDYDRDLGWATRLALPWEIGYYYRQQPPLMRARTLLKEFATQGGHTLTTMHGSHKVDVFISEDHVTWWKQQFEVFPEG